MIHLLATPKIVPKELLKSDQLLFFIYHLPTLYFIEQKLSVKLKQMMF